jgi:CspA family cold shock protein
MTIQYSTVKWFDAKKGYGFINHPDGGDDVFIHYSQIESDDDFKTLRTGQSVQFEMNDGPKGLHAVNVQALDDGQSDSTADVSDEPSHMQTATDAGHTDRVPASPSTAEPAPSDPEPAGATAEHSKSDFVDYGDSDYDDSDYDDSDYDDLDDDYGTGSEYGDSDYGDTGYDEGDLV